LNLNWTTIIASAFTACIVGTSQFITTRYLARILDRLEKNTEKKDEKDK
jgi:hypothetical protein